MDFLRFAVAGHDRGGRVAYRMALDHPERIDRLAALDILPVETVWQHADARFALGYWPWSLLAQPEPLPRKVSASLRRDGDRPYAGRMGSAGGNISA